MLAKLFKNLNPKKADGHDKISLRLLKVYGSPIYRPLEMIFQEAASTVFFPIKHRSYP